MSVYTVLVICASKSEIKSDSGSKRNELKMSISDKVNGILIGFIEQEKTWVEEHYNLIVLLNNILYDKRL